VALKPIYEVETSFPKRCVALKLARLSEAMLSGMLANGILHDELRTMWLKNISINKDTYAR